MVAIMAKRIHQIKEEQIEKRIEEQPINGLQIRVRLSNALWLSGCPNKLRAEVLELYDQCPTETAERIIAAAFRYHDEHPHPLFRHAGWLLRSAFQSFVDAQNRLNY